MLWISQYYFPQSLLAFLDTTSLCVSMIKMAGFQLYTLVNGRYVLQQRPRHCLGAGMGMIEDKSRLSPMFLTWVNEWNEGLALDTCWISAAFGSGDIQHASGHAVKTQRTIWIKTLIWQQLKGMVI